MPKGRTKPATRTAREVPRLTTPRRDWLEPRSLAGDSSSPLPAVRLRTFRRHPHVYRKFVGSVQGNPRPGDLVEVWLPEGSRLGYGFYNPMAEIAVRLVSLGPRVPNEEFWRQRLQSACALRRELLNLDQQTDACRLIHAEGDEFPGLIIDLLGGVVSAEVHSLAMYQRSAGMLALLAELLGPREWLVQIPGQVHGQEGFLAEPCRSPGLPGSVIVSEFGTRFRVDFAAGHKTGFFCDQRDNRRKLADLAAGKRVLDACCYTGGFALQALRLGQASQATGVDLDERAIELARANARLNGAQAEFVHADAFGYMRDMLANARQYDVVVVDPPKWIRNRAERDSGEAAYRDINRLAIELVAPGGLLLTCSCSGLLDEQRFLQIVRAAAWQARAPGAAGECAARGRGLQLLAKTGAAADHPVSLACPETEYLHALWFRVN